MVLEAYAYLQATSTPRIMAVIAHTVVGQVRGYCIPREDPSLLSREYQANNISTQTQRGLERTGNAAVENSGKATTNSIRTISCSLGLRRKPLNDVNAAIVHSRRRGTVHYKLLLGDGARAQCRRGHRDKERHPSHSYCIGPRWTTGLGLAPHEPPLQERRQEMRPTSSISPTSTCPIK